MTEASFVSIQSVPRKARKTFCCSTEALDRYFQTQAKQDARRNIAATFVLVRREEAIGYYTLSAAEVKLGELPAGFRARYPRYAGLPATRLGRLAVDQRFQRQGWGEKLLIDALFRAVENAEVIGSIALIVDAKEEARAFYLKYGFLEFPDTPDKLFLPMDTARCAVEAGRAAARTSAGKQPSTPQDKPAAV